MEKKKITVKILRSPSKLTDQERILNYLSHSRFLTAPVGFLLPALLVISYSLFPIHVFQKSTPRKTTGAYIAD